VSVPVFNVTLYLPGGLGRRYAAPLVVASKRERHGSLDCVFIVSLCRFFVSTQVEKDPKCDEAMFSKKVDTMSYIVTVLVVIIRHNPYVSAYVFSYVLDCVLDCVLVYAMELRLSAYMMELRLSLVSARDKHRATLVDDLFYCMAMHSVGFIIRFKKWTH
jgi:hypothetical protein